MCGFPNERFGGPYNKDYSIWRSILGSAYSGKLLISLYCEEVIIRGIGCFVWCDVYVNSPCNLSTSKTAARTRQHVPTN